MADIPGIIEGASEGRGLGLRFLRHIERNSLLLFMIPADSEDIIKEYKILSAELAKYNPDLAEKTRVLAITKCDLTAEKPKKLPKDLPHVYISAVANQGLDDLKDILWRELTRETFQDKEKIIHKNMEI